MACTKMGLGGKAWCGRLHAMSRTRNFGFSSLITSASLLLASAGCGTDDGDVGLFTDSGNTSLSTSTTGVEDSTDGSADASSSTGSDAEGTSTGGSTGPLLDVGGESASAEGGGDGWRVGLCP